MIIFATSLLCHFSKKQKVGYGRLNQAGIDIFLMVKSLLTPCRMS